MKTIFKLSFITFFFLVVTSCKKNQTGGKATLKGVVMHHDKPIPDANVYVKFNASEFPGNDYRLYDTYVKADANGNYSVSFFKGTYYIYAIGRDLNVPFPYEVKGGLSVTLRNKETLVKNIAVTED
jgi:hypothetical protein